MQPAAHDHGRPGVPFDVRVVGPDCEPIDDLDLRRLFPGSSLTEERLNRLRQWPRILVLCCGRVVAVATCQRVDLELRVPEIGLANPCDCGERAILHALFDALEVAAMAGGCQRLVISPPRMSLMSLERRGYRRVRASCAGAWVEKRLA